MKKNGIAMCLAVLLSAALLNGCGAQADIPEELASAASGVESGIESAAALPESTPPAPAPAEQERRAVLVVWFSATGTTEGVAQRLAERLSADTYEIVPETPYTESDLDYGNGGSRATQEQKDGNARPAIAGALPDMEPYDTVFIGYPIWFGQAPRIVDTFLEGCDLTGKTVVPFCTSGSSGIGASAENLRPLASAANWMEGKRFDGNAAGEEIAAWANGFVAADALRIEIGDAVLTATLADNSSAAALRELLADGGLTVRMHDYGGFEKVGPLGSALPRNDESITAKPGDIILYQGDQITISYGENTWELTRLGKIEGVTAQELRDLLGEGDVTAAFTLAGR